MGEGVTSVGIVLEDVMDGEVEAERPCLAEGVMLNELEGAMRDVFPCISDSTDILRAAPGVELLGGRETRFEGAV